MEIKRITVCGGGNGAHALVPVLLAKKEIEVNLYLPIEREYIEFKNTKESGKPFILNFIGERREVSLERLNIISDPEKAAEADLIIIVTPAFAHEGILGSLVPYLSSGTILSALPARGGFEYQASAVLNEHKKEGIIIAGFQTLPWACRIVEYSGSVEIYGQKSKVGFASLPSLENSHIAESLRALLGLEITVYNNMLELTLNNQGQIIHPGIMCGLFSGKSDVRYSIEEIPLFYRSVDTKTADILAGMSGEIQKVKTVLSMDYDVDLHSVRTIREWMLDSYGENFSKESTLDQMFQTNPSYKTLKAPVKKVDGFFKVDVTARYITEDVPFGLLVSKAIAELAGVETPEIDKVVNVTEGWMGLQYLKNGKLKGKDIKNSRIPQNYGFENLKSIIDLVKTTQSV